MSPVTISDEAKQLLRERMAASGIARPFAVITMHGMEEPKDKDGDPGVDWTIKRRDLWTVVVADRPKLADDSPQVVMVDGIRFVSDFFPIRYEISVREGRFRVAAAA